MSVTMRQVIDALHDHIADRYTAGDTVAALSRRHGISTSTITDNLKKRGVYQPGRKSGPPLAEKCQRGHDMGIHRRWGPDGAFCSECKRERERVK